MQETIGKTDNGEPLQMDVMQLVDTKMLITANSGGGKSWLLRLIAECASPHIQTIILDPEGEFVTLREKMDFVLVGKSGDVPADPRSAGLLARRLLELNVSAVIDLYELPLAQRREFVKQFLDSLISLPKSLWHPTLIVLDEAHLFCPEKSAGEAVSTGAVINLMSLGRKRGFAGILATQRLSKLHKDAAAEANNVMVGRTVLDIDQKRSADVLGFSMSERSGLRDLAAGEFFGYGPALSKNGVTRFRSAKVSTTHPKAGSRHTIQAPRPSGAISKVVSELSDIPRVAEAEAKDLSTAKVRIKELEKLLAAKPAPLMSQTDIDAAVEKCNQGWQQVLARVAKDTTDRFAKIQALLGLDGLMPDPNSPTVVTSHASSFITAQSDSVKFTPTVEKRSVPGKPVSGSARGLQKAERKILIAFYWTKDDGQVSPAKIGFYSGYSHSSGGFNNALGKLRNQYGYLTGWNLTPAGNDVAATLAEEKPRGMELREWLRSKMGKAENEILDVLIAEAGSKLSAVQIAERTASNYSPGSGGFNNALGTLRKLEAAIGYDRDGGTMANPVFYE